LNFLYITAICFYQSYLSKHKGYSCAHRILNNGDSCSAAILNIVKEKGAREGKKDILNRLYACKHSHSVLIKRKDKDKSVGGVVVEALECLGEGICGSFSSKLFIVNISLRSVINRLL
jgi:putative component of membrane protein insertase Oxa1/YidC/SpoIIIJ protein YidD